MKQLSTNDFMKGSRFSGESYGKKITIEVDHSDLDMNELMDIFKGIAMGLGFAEYTWNGWIKETANDIQLEKEDTEINLRHSNEHWNNEITPTFDWDNDYFNTVDEDTDTSADANHYIVDEGDTITNTNVINDSSTETNTID